ncbi:MAG: hypothetical protein R6X02_33855 [Enhygromyxa sp.]
MRPSTELIVCVCGLFALQACAHEATATHGHPSEADDGDGDHPCACTSPEPTDASLADDNACALVLDRVYTSNEQLECGLGPGGVALCYWSVRFDGEQFVWNYSDISEAGGYDCVDLDLVARPDGEHLGTVSADGSSLIWSGVGYSRVDP